MNPRLPEGCRFVSELEFTPDDAYKLLNNAVEACDTDNLIPLANEDIMPSADPSTDSKDVLNTVLGVYDGDDKLIAYAGATLDTAQQHATIECLAVDPYERGQGVGTALAEAFCNQLDRQGANNISFQAFGEVGWLLPYLQEQQGFIYTPLSKEYISQREPVVVTPESLGLITFSDASNSHIEEISQPEQPLDTTEIEIFKSVVEEVLQKTVEYVAAEHLAASSWNRFKFEVAGRKFMVHRGNLKQGRSWQVCEYDLEEIIPTSRGLKEILDRRYKVRSAKEKSGADKPTFSQRVFYEFPTEHSGITQTSESEVLPFSFERLREIMPWLARLDPAKHLIRESEPLADLAPSKHIVY